MKVLKLLFVLLPALSFKPCQAQGDQELNSGFVIGWQCVSKPPKANAVYKTVKSQQTNGNVYTQR